MQHQHTQTPSDRPRFWRSRYGVAFLIIAAVAAYFLLKEHRHMLPAISPSCCWRLVR